MIENLKKLIRNILEFKTWFTLSYHRLKLKLPFNPRKGICKACGRRCFSNIHHWLYRYTYSEIYRDNKLALKYTTELCYPDHDLGDAMRKLFNIDPDLKIVTRSKILNKLIELRAQALREGGNP